MPDANIVRLSLCLAGVSSRQSDARQDHSGTLTRLRATAPRPAETSVLVRPSEPPMRSQSQQRLVLSAARGVAMCRYQPRSDLRYAHANLGKEHTSQSSTHKTEHAEHPVGQAHCEARKTGAFHTCAHLSLLSHQHVGFKWAVFDVTISMTVHVDYTSPMIRRRNILGDGLACVSLPFLHTTLGEYQNLQI